MATLNKGDEVIIPAPFWVSYPDMVLLAGGTPKIIKCEEKDGFKLSAKKLEKAISKKTKWLILNSPSNPTGAGYTKKEIEDLSKILLKHKKIFILSDDIYEHIRYEGFNFFTIAQISKLKERTLTMNGVSKSYAMTGWRIGYAAGPKEIINAIRKIQSQSTSNPSSISNILLGMFSASFFSICLTFKLNIWSTPEKPVSRETKAFCNDSLKFLPMAIASPTDFIDVPNTAAEAENFSKVNLGILVTT